MRSIIFAATVAIALSGTACSSSYHPEYHPVTVTNVSQNLSYPAPVAANGAPVYVIPAPSPPVFMVPEAPPPDFFR